MVGKMRRANRQMRYWEALCHGDLASARTFAHQFGNQHMKFGVTSSDALAYAIAAVYAFDEGLSLMWFTGNSMATGVWNAVTGRDYVDELKRHMPIEGVIAHFGSTGPLGARRFATLLSVSFMGNGLRFRPLSGDSPHFAEMSGHPGGYRPI